MRPLPKWVGTGAVLGLQGGTAAVNATLGQVEREWGNMSDVAAVWLQDWTGQRNFSGKNDLARVGLWWNWEVIRYSCLYLQVILLQKHYLLFNLHVHSCVRMSLFDVHVCFIPNKGAAKFIPLLSTNLHTL